LREPTNRKWRHFGWLNVSRAFRDIDTIQFRFLLTFQKSLDVFGREGRLGTRTIRITAMGETDPITPSAPSAASATMHMVRV
jgi:hypothetical protein